MELRLSWKPANLFTPLNPPGGTYLIMLIKPSLGVEGQRKFWKQPVILTLSIFVCLTIINITFL